MINLLLRGEDPAKILCITFTKAAAATMATRVFDTLAKWTALDDAALDENIRLVTGKTADATQRAVARRLFANALETPGGLKVQTIHAFCTIAVTCRSGQTVRHALRCSADRSRTAAQ